MSFKFNCPYCDQRIEAEDEWEGLESQCPTCGKTIKIQKAPEPKLVAESALKNEKPIPESPCGAPEPAPEPAPETSTPEPQAPASEPEQPGKKTNVFLLTLLAILKFLKKILDGAALKIGDFINKKSKKDFNPQISGYIVLGVVVLICGTIFSQLNLNLGSKISTAVACLIDREGYYMEKAKKALYCEDNATALKIYREWAAKDSSEANLRLGLILMVLKEDQEYMQTAFKHLRKSVELGNIYAKLIVGNFYIEGIGTEQNESLGKKYVKEAFTAIKELAENNDCIAMVEFSNCYKNGFGVKQDGFEAFKWMKKAAQQGYAPGQHQLGLMYRNAIGVSRDRKQALAWLGKAGVQNYIPSQVELGDMYEDRREYEDAFKWYSAAASQGHISSQGKLGDFYRKGHAVEEDLTKAAQCYLMAAQRGNPKYQYEYAECLAEGEGVEKNWEAAVEWYRKSARNGYGYAKETLRSRDISW